MGLIPGRVKPNRVFIEIPEAHNIKELRLADSLMKVCQNGVVICLAMNCCVSERDIITKLAQRIGLSRWNHDVEYNSSLKISNGQSEAANRRIDNTEHLISRPVFVGFLLFNLFCVLFCNKMKTKYTTLSEKFKVHKSLYFVVGSVSFVIVLSVT